MTSVEEYGEVKEKNKSGGRKGPGPASGSQVDRYISFESCLGMFFVEGCVSSCSKVKNNRAPEPSQHWRKKQIQSWPKTCAQCCVSAGVHA